MSFSVVWSSDKKKSICLPVVAHGQFIVANFKPDYNVVLHGNPQTQILYRSHELGGSNVVTIQANGTRQLQFTKNGFDMLKVLRRLESTTPNNVFSLRPDELPAEIIYDMLENTITYTDRRRMRKYISRYTLTDIFKSNTWKVHLADDVVIEMSEDRLSQLGWFAMMQSHACRETEEMILHLETCTLDTFTRMMRFAECGILILPLDAPTETLMELYKTFEFFDVSQACEYIAEVALCQDNISDATIEALLSDINTHDILRRRFVMLMEWRFTKNVADMIRDHSHDLPVLIADLFHLIPHRSCVFGDSELSVARRVIVKFDSDDETLTDDSDNTENIIQPQVRDYNYDNESVSSVSDSDSESELYD